MKNQKKILPMTTNTLIKTYPYNAFYLGILEANKFEIENILIKEFFNLFSFHARKSEHIDFTGSGHVEKNRFITKYDINPRKVTTNYLKQKIEDNYYLMINLNEKYLNVPGIDPYKDFCHDWLIYGYNDYDKSFNCCGYINIVNKGSYFGTVKVNYNDLICSINNVPYLFEYSKPRNLKCHSLKINFKNKENDLSKEVLIRKLEKFYEPRTFEIYHKVFIHNDINAIKRLIKSFKKRYVNELSDSKTLINDEIFLQDFRTLYEHKKVFHVILKKIKCSEKIINKQEELIRIAYKNLINCFKYNFNPSNSLSRTIYDTLIYSEINQYNIIKQVLEENH